MESSSRIEKVKGSGSALSARSRWRLSPVVKIFDVMMNNFTRGYCLLHVSKEEGRDEGKYI